MLNNLSAIFQTIFAVVIMCATLCKVLGSIRHRMSLEGDGLPGLILSECLSRCGVSALIIFTALLAFVPPTAFNNTFIGVATRFNLPIEAILVSHLLLNFEGLKGTESSNTHHTVLTTHPFVSRDNWTVVSGLEQGTQGGSLFQPIESKGILSTMYEETQTVEWRNEPNDIEAQRTHTKEPDTPASWQCRGEVEEEISLSPVKE